MHTVILTELMHEAGMGLLRGRASVRLVIALPGSPEFEAALPEAVGIGVHTARLPAGVVQKRVTAGAGLTPPGRMTAP